MISNKQLSMYVCASLLLFTAAACEREGPAERAGKQIDKAAEELKSGATPPAGPLEEAGKKIDDAAKNAGDAIDRATRR